MFGLFGVAEDGYVQCSDVRAPCLSVGIGSVFKLALSDQIFQPIAWFQWCALIR